MSNKEKKSITYERWFSSVWAIPALFLGIAIVAFGLLLPKLGYYMDDWHFVYYAHTFGVDSLRELLLYDSRPYAAWIYILGFRLLGFQPVAWHVGGLILRAATAFIFLQFFQHLWPGKKSLGFSIAIIFLVYPFFLLQPMAVAYFIHWFGFLLYALSLFLMVLAFESVGQRRFGLIGLALFLEALHLFSSEFFAGLELLRALILWVMIARTEKKFFAKFWKTFLTWLPYLLVFCVYAFWRGALFSGPVNRNSPVLIEEFFAAPFNTAFSVLILAVKDGIAILFNGWQKILTPSAFDLSSVFTIFTLFVMSFTFVVLVRFFPHFLAVQKKKSAESETSRWRQEAVFLGIAAIPLGELPIWLLGKAITTHTNQMAATRFGLASMIGAAILLAVVIDFFIENIKKESIVLALVVGLAVGAHLHNAHEYERSWEKQKNLYQQLALRIPGVAPNTEIISAGEILFFMGEYPTSNAINMIYSSGENLPSDAPYWFSSLYGSYSNRFDAFFDGMPLEEQHLSSKFTGNSLDTVVISFEPEQRQCLWVLRPEDANLRLISDLERRASLISALDRIDINAKREMLLPSEIFGTEIPNNWCSYYQKADLARQRNEWWEVVSLWQEAQENEKRPENGFEYIPFIEGYAHQNDWSQVKKLTRQANKISLGMYHILCPTLENIEETTPVSSERDAIITDLRDYLNCQ